MKQWLAANLIIVRDWKILLAKRAKEEKDFSNCWSIPWWTIEFWETPQNAVEREIREELSVNIKNYTLFGIYSFLINPALCFYWVYFVWDIVWEPKLLEQELSEYKWFDIWDGLLELDFAFNQKDIIRDYLIKN